MCGGTRRGQQAGQTTRPAAGHAYPPLTTAPPARSPPQIFKNSLTTLPMGGGKGGSDFDPKGAAHAGPGAGGCPPLPGAMRPCMPATQPPRCPPCSGMTH